MKRIPLLCLVLLASAGVRAEWLTLTGTPGDATSSYVQVDPTSIEVDGTHRIVALRMNMQADRINRDGSARSRPLPTSIATPAVPAM